jgi:Flp pilus assembly protein TadD
MRRSCSLFCLLLALIGVPAFNAVPQASAANLRITIPKRSKPTPVQQLNRDGVKAVQKRDFNRAKKLFYKAYLLDPNDPFTLNNLGYISELEGDVDRAQRYYALSAEMNSDAVVDRASTSSVEGKPVAEIAGNAADKGMQINRLNVEAMGLLQKDRAPEAEILLGKALTLDQRNPFTLNNIGFAREQAGELESALSYYTAAAATRSSEPIIVTVNGDWRGKPISEVAERNAKSVRRTIEKQGEDRTSEIARLNLRGVSAINRNDRRAAREYFQKAYKLDQSNGFTLNNMGYLAEMDGDRETAQFYYAKAQEADEAKAKVTLSTRKDFLGHPLREVADYGTTVVEARMESELAAKRRQGGPVQLRRRDGSIIVEPLAPPRREALPASDQPSQQPSQGFLQPLPDNQQPAAPLQAPQSQPQELLQPLPDEQQPGAANQKKEPQQQELLQPLPDDQQPADSQTKPGQKQQKPKPPR